MSNIRLRKLALQYRPHGKRDTGRPRRRWREQRRLKENELQTFNVHETISNFACKVLLILIIKPSNHASKAFNEGTCLDSRSGHIIPGENLRYSLNFGFDRPRRRSEHGSEAKSAHPHRH